MGGRSGFTLVELLVVVALLGSLALAGLGFQGEMVARMEVEAATRRVLQGLERGRIRAERHARPCALSLQAGGWAAPTSGHLPACFDAAHEPPDGLRGAGGLQLEHNLPEAVRFSSNGLVLDGGTVVVSHGASPLRRCVVVSLPLGITRVGLHSQAGCLPDPNL